MCGGQADDAARVHSRPAGVADGPRHIVCAVHEKLDTCQVVPAAFSVPLDGSYSMATTFCAVNSKLQVACEFAK